MIQKENPASGAPESGPWIFIAAAASGIIVESLGLSIQPGTASSKDTREEAESEELSLCKTIRKCRGHLVLNSRSDREMNLHIYLPAVA
jgi:hypothetical protein